MIWALVALVAGNSAFGIWSHFQTGSDIRSTRNELVSLINGRLREDGPVAAQATAAAKRSDRTVHAVRSSALNL